MTQDNKTDKSSFDKELADKIAHIVAIEGMRLSLELDNHLDEAYFQTACAFALMIAENDEAAMQEFRVIIGSEESKRPEVAEGVSND